MAKARFRILVVDDEPTVRDVAMIELQRDGFECDAAIDGAEALEMLEISRYDAVITDLRMPTLHGHALAVELLAREDRPVLVVVTAVDEPRLAKDLLSRGVDDVFFKPVHYNLLAVKLRTLIEQRRAAVATSGDQGDS